MNIEHTSIPTADTTPEIASLCKAAGDVLRLRILKVLASGSFAVQELCRIVDLKQSALSHHLKVLSQAGLVETHREGNTIFYRRSVASSSQHCSLMQALFNAVNELELPLSMQQAMETLFTERTAKSELFFEQVGSDFNEHQERIAQSITYMGAALELIDQAPEGNAMRSVLEIGPGEGAMLHDLSQRFSHVVALDTSKEMLLRAKNHTQAENVHFIHGDLLHPSVASEQFDCIVLCMVLHHIASPLELLKQMAKHLKPNGMLVLTDLAAHGQDWVQQSCGDLWLGFSGQQLSQWADLAHLHEQHSLYLSQRNGFQVVAKQYTHANFSH